MKNNSFSHSKIISNIPVHYSSRYFSCSAASLTSFQATENSHSMAADGAWPVTAGSCFHFSPSPVWETEPRQRTMPWAFPLPWNPARLSKTETLGKEGTRHFLGKLQHNQRVEELTHKESTKCCGSEKREKCWKLRYTLEDNQLESGLIMGFG